MWFLRITTVIIGRYKVGKSMDVDKAEKYIVESFVKHHKYNRETRENDIALLRLKETIIFKARKETRFVSEQIYVWSTVS